MSTGANTYCLDFLPRMAAVHPWFYTNLLKLVVFQLIGLSVLKDNSYKAKTILQINKLGTYAKAKWMCYDSTHKQ